MSGRLPDREREGNQLGLDIAAVSEILAAQAADLRRAAERENRRKRLRQSLTPGALILAFIAVFNGVPAAMVSWNAEQTADRQECTAYYQEIGDLVDQGIAAHVWRLVNDPEIEGRCGDAEEIAESWGAAVADEAP